MTPTSPETDDELLIRIQSGDEQAFLTLYRRRQAALYRFAVHMSGSMTVAEDVVQEVFLALLREARLVKSRRKGTRHIYKIDFAGLASLRAYLDSFWDDVLDAYAAGARPARRTKENR